MIQLRHFSKSYGRCSVLDMAGLVLSAGVYWIQGKNGTGKSTFLKCMAGMLAFKGEISVENISLKKDPRTVKRIVSYAEAEPQFPLFMTGMDILDICIQSKNGNRNEVEKMLADLGMDNYIHAPMASYSSGMLKKVSIVAAFVGNTKWVLLDEPLNAMDRASVSILYQWIRDATQNGKSFILSSHQPLDTSPLGDMVTLHIVNKQIVTADAVTVNPVE